MATSGSVNFTVTRNQIIEGAYRCLGVMAENQTLSSYHETIASEALNMLVKQWQGKTDFAPGLKEWCIKRGTLFLQTNTGSYSLGPSGDNATNSFVSTTLTAAAATSATSLTVSSITGITSGDYIGIELDDGTLHWDVVNGAPSGSTVTITTGLASAAASGRYVYAYTTKINRPLEILTAYIRNTDNSDTPLGNMDLGEYEGIATKSADGTPARIYYERQLTDGVLYLDVEPDDVTKQIKFSYLSPIEDFDASTDNPAYPQEWFRALKFNLAKDLFPEFPKASGITIQALSALANESLTIAQNVYPETTTLFFEPGID